MVYVPLEVVRRLVLARWEKDKTENPDLPRPTRGDVLLEWYKLEDFYPKDANSFHHFRNQFPLEDRKYITFRLYTGPSYRATEERQRRRRR